MRRFQPSVYGGLFIGILSALPIVGAANVCCCLWVVVGGLLTVYLQRQSAEPTQALDAAEAVLGGLVAGLIGAVIYVGFTAVLMQLSDGQAADRIRTQLEQSPQLSAEVRDWFETLFSGGRGRILLPILLAALTIPTYAVFGMLGALLGLAFFRKAPAASSET